MSKLTVFQKSLLTPLIVIGALIASMTSTSFFGLSKTAIAQPKLSQTQNSEELPLPDNGTVIRYLTPSSEEQLAPLSIITDGNPNGPQYFIKLADWSTNQTVLTLFLRAGLKTSVEVPLGIYKIKIASGTHWYGINKVFGPTTDYSLIAKPSGDSKMVFEAKGKEVIGHELTLRNVRNGNVRRKPISPKEF
jgi:hypothetical protein